MKDKLLQIINRYGIEHQQRKLEEEVFELQEAITKYEYVDFTELEDITQELADVQVMLKQFQYFYAITDEKIEKVMLFKVDRQLERIENERNNI
jgi:NTP pyrophosphatase (non-canonical NTP hydrolase)